FRRMLFRSDPRKTRKRLSVRPARSRAALTPTAPHLTDDGDRAFVIATPLSPSLSGRPMPAAGRTRWLCALAVSAVRRLLRRPIFVYFVVFVVRRLRP